MESKIIFTRQIRSTLGADRGGANGNRHGQGQRKQMGIGLAETDGDRDSGNRWGRGWWKQMGRG